MNTIELPHIDDCPELNAADESCFAELRSVLEKHGMEKRFGVMLMHSHFAVSEDEILLESCDETSRTLTIKPISLNEAANVRSRPTNWRLDSLNSIQSCLQICTEENEAPHRHTGTSHL